MNNERPVNHVPGAKDIEHLLHDNPVDPREQNGTGEQADEQQLGITEEEVNDLEDDAKGG
jgi:hypothetical protein